MEYITNQLQSIKHLINKDMYVHLMSADKYYRTIDIIIYTFKDYFRDNELHLLKKYLIQNDYIKNEPIISINRIDVFKLFNIALSTIILSKEYYKDKFNPKEFSLIYSRIIRLTHYIDPYFINLSGMSDIKFNIFKDDENSTPIGSTTISVYSSINDQSNKPSFKDLQNNKIFNIDRLLVNEYVDLIIKGFINNNYIEHKKSETETVIDVYV